MKPKLTVTRIISFNLFVHMNRFYDFFVPHKGLVFSMLRPHLIAVKTTRTSGFDLRSLQTESGREASAQAAKLEQWVYAAGIQTERQSGALSVLK